jgi:hypothetical protein
MWHRRFVAVLRVFAGLLFGWSYFAGYIVLAAGVHVVGAIAGVSLAAASVVCLVLGRARYMYIAALFMALGTALYPLYVVAPFGVMAILATVIVGITTIAYGGADLRACGGEPFRDPIDRWLDDDDDACLVDEVHVPTATVLASDRHAAKTNRHDPRGRRVAARRPRAPDRRACVDGGCAADEPYDE